MSTIEKKKIGNMSLEEMIAASRFNAVKDLPTQGGPYDTSTGWQRRLGLGREELDALCKWLGDECERRRGFVMRATGPYRCTLIYSTVLEAKAKELATKKPD